ncbi:MAG: phosphate regulon sensor histidine kinase PhoR [Steroidobacteraceae bacterium]
MLFGRALSGTAGQTLFRLAGALLLALVAGLIFGHPAAILITVLSVYLAIQVLNLLRLDRWLRRRRTELPPDINGPWGEVIATVNRIYRRKQFHKARVLRLLREFRRLTAAMPDGAVLLGPNNEIIWFNRNAAAWLGLRRKLDFGIRIENLVRDPQFIRYMNEPGSQSSVTIHELTQGDRWLELHLVTTSASVQKLVIIRDVTREVRIESIRRDFVANASHEMRSPLTVIAGYLDALAEEQQLDATWREPVQEMRRQADRMRGIINDLLELSRLEASGGASGDQDVDVGGLLALLKRDLMAQEHRPQTIDLNVESPDHLRGTESELHSVFSNLISNAAKYTPAEGEIAIRFWVDAAGAHVSVRDTGIGFAPEHIPRLTERFYRVDAGRSRKIGGSGLGLAIVKHALQRHGGTLSIESVEGRGSTFTCHFPPDRVLRAEQGIGN